MDVTDAELEIEGADFFVVSSKDFGCFEPGSFAGTVDFLLAGLGDIVMR